jgi:hypothetical protein
MGIVKKVILPISLATLWIGASEFARNQLLFRSYWVEHYRGLGLEFPAAPINGALWGVWSLLYAIAIFFAARRSSLVRTWLYAWLVGFAMMWVVIGNLGVLPYRLLVPALPLSLLEAFVAALILRKLAAR